MNNIVVLTLQHFILSIKGVASAVLIGIPLGFMALRYKKKSQFILLTTEIMQVFPSLALLAVLLYFWGLSDTTLVATLFLYSLMPIVSGTFTGFKSISLSVYEIAWGIGMNRWQILVYVELPLALPHILNGIRIALVTAIGITTIGVLVGAGGLGNLIWRGIQTQNTKMIISGAVPAALLAMLVDVFMHTLEVKITPWVNRNISDL